MTVKVEIEGNEYRPLYLSLQQSMASHHNFEIVMHGQAFLEDNSVGSLSNVKDLIGKMVKIQISPPEEESESLFFQGPVTQLSFSREFGSATQYVLSGSSATILLEDGLHSRSFSELSIQSIALQVLEPYRLSHKVNAKRDISPTFYVQYQESNFRFLARIADHFGEWLYYDGRGLIFGKLQDEGEIELKVGALSDYSFSMSLAPANLSYVNYDYLSNIVYRGTTADAHPGSLDTYGQHALEVSSDFYSQETVLSEREEARSQKELDEMLSRIAGSLAANMVALNGASNNPGLRLGTVIKIKENDGKEVGSFIITKISHMAEGIGQYRNTFFAIPKPIQVPPLDTILGRQYPKPTPQSATVKENNDPEGLGRVRVQFHWQKEGEMTPWIRVLNPQGASSGFYFVPEVGDEVMVGFEFDNPNRPYVQGGVYHGKAKPQYATDNNAIKAITTKGGNRILLVDGDEGEIRILNRDKKNEIRLSLAEDGQVLLKSEGKISLEAREIEMKAETIVLNADKGLDLKSGQDAKLEGQNVDLEAQQSAALKGLDVNVEAGNSGKVKAASQLSIDGGAVTEVKGGVIKLN